MTETSRLQRCAFPDCEARLIVEHTKGGTLCSLHRQRAARADGRSPGDGHGPTGPKRGRALTPHAGVILHEGPGVDLEPARLGHLADALLSGMTPGEQLDRNALGAAIAARVRRVDPADLLSAVALLVTDGRATTSGTGVSQTWSAT